QQLSNLATAVAARLNVADLEVREPPSLGDLDLRAPRITPPAALAPICSTDQYDRAGHTYGKSFRDVVRAFHGHLPGPPDVVAFPRHEDDVVDLLDWCGDNDVAAIPYGGGSSVVGGVEGAVGDDYDGVISIDLGTMDPVQEVNRVCS